MDTCRKLTRSFFVQGYKVTATFTMVAGEPISTGQFLSWIAAEFEMSQQTANNFTSVYERFGNGNFPFLNLKPSILYALSAPSTVFDWEPIPKKIGHRFVVEYRKKRDAVIKSVADELNGSVVVIDQLDRRTLITAIQPGDSETIREYA